MAQQVLLPKLGLTMQEGTIVEWVAKSGEVVRTGDVIMRLATDKVDVDVEAEGEGRFEPVALEGATLPPGALVAWLLAGDEQVPEGPAPADAPVVAATAGPEVDQPRGGQNGSPHGGRVKASPNARRVARESGVELAGLRGTGPGGRIVSEDVEDAVQLRLSSQVSHAPQAAQAPPVVPSARDDLLPGSVASPLVRRHAVAQGVDISRVRGTGLGGRIRRTDVEKAAAEVAAPPVRAEGPRAGQVIPLTGMRGAIARNMHASLQEMAQLTHGYEAEVGALIELRERLKVEWSGTGLPVPTINDFVMRAAAHALVEHPILNATVRADGIHLLEEVHVGFAVAVPDGLVVPVVRHADRRPLVEIAQESQALATAAREGRLTLPQMEGASFVVTALGSYGVDFFTPVVNPGNVGILGVGRIRDSVRWEGEVPHRSQVLTLSLSFDHRAVDGAPAAEFLRTVSGLLGRPLLLLAG